MSHLMKIVLICSSVYFFSSIGTFIGGPIDGLRSYLMMLAGSFVGLGFAFTCIASTIMFMEGRGR